jgi:tyrosine-specific transport protein
MLGGILLIVGTTIGGGMLALPVVTAQGGFWGAIGLLLVSWVIMTFSAFLILEINLWLPTNSNIILMAKRTLGPWAAIVAWLCYLLIFYCLLAAYIAGGSDIIHDIINASGLHTSTTLDAVLFALVVGFIVYNGIKSIDYVNRGLMFIKLAAFILLVLFVTPHVDLSRYAGGQLTYLIPAVTVVITSFGFATIIPSLRSYFHNDVTILRKVILIGSMIPLLCYILWVAVIFGGIPFSGDHSLLSIINAEHSTSALNEALIFHLHNASITTLTRVFTSVCVVTSFLGVSLCVVDFLADGLSIENLGVGKFFLHLITFIPPLIIALLFPTAFILGLNYAGICIAILIILLPALMAWNGRYRMRIAADYRVVGGKIPLILLMLVAFFIIGQGLLHMG